MATNDKAFSPWLFVGGIAAGAGLWYLFTRRDEKAPGVTQAAPMPTVATPARFADLASVAARLDQVKTLYRSGTMSPEQALAEANGLSAAANSFSLQDGEAASEVVAGVLAFQAQVEDFVSMRSGGVVGPLPAMSVFG